MYTFWTCKAFKQNLNDSSNLYWRNTPLIINISAHCWHCWSSADIQTHTRRLIAHIHTHVRRNERAILCSSSLLPVDQPSFGISVTSWRVLKEVHLRASVHNPVLTWIMDGKGISYIVWLVTMVTTGCYSLGFYTG